MLVWLDEVLWKTFQIEVDLLMTKLLKLKTHIVGIHCKTNASFLLAYVACRSAGCCPVILCNCPHLEQEILRIGMTYVLSGDVHGVRIVEFPIHTSRYDQFASKKFSVICRSSGSTGFPKYIGWDEEVITYQTIATHACMQYTDQDKFCPMLPLWSSYGLSLIHICMQFSLSIVLIRKRLFPQQVSVWKDTQTTVIDSIPSWYGSVAKRLISRPGLLKKLHCIRMWCCGGEVLSGDLFKLWVEVTGKFLFDGYGLTEAGPNIALSNQESHRINRVGLPLPGIEMMIDAHQLFIKTPSLCKGIWNHVSLLWDCPKDWFATGDAAEIDEEGFLSIKGRLDTMIHINGYNVYPEVVERILSLLPEIEQNVVVCQKKKHKNRLVAYLVSKEATPSQKLTHHCAKFLDPYMIPSQFVFISRIDRLPSGKIDRQGFQERVMRHEL